MPYPACYQVFGRDFYIEPASAQFANAVFQDEYQIKDLRLFSENDTRFLSQFEGAV